MSAPSCVFALVSARRGRGGAEILGGCDAGRFAGPGMGVRFRIVFWDVLDGTEPPLRVVSAVASALVVQIGSACFFGMSYRRMLPPTSAFGAIPR